MIVLQILPFVQIGIAVLLVAVILLQQKGEGLSATFGGGGGGVYRTKRGLEKILFISTIVLAALFLLAGLTSVFIGARSAPAPVSGQQPPSPVTHQEETVPPAAVQVPKTNISDIQFETVPSTPTQPPAPDGTR